MTDGKLPQAAKSLVEVLMRDLKGGKALRHLAVGSQMHFLTSMSRTRQVFHSSTTKQADQGELDLAGSAVAGVPGGAAQFPLLVDLKGVVVAVFIKAEGEIREEENDHGEIVKRYAHLLNYLHKCVYSQSRILRIPAHESRPWLFLLNGRCSRRSSSIV